jgi:DHA1 family bicyclomycin/chloramphenicol resistance-like MFS transporter
VPSLPYIDEALGTGPTLVKLTMSAFLWAFAISQIIYGPLSDRFGRRPVLLGGIALYLVASLVCALAPNIEILILGRFLQGVGACAGGSIYRAVIRDLFDRTGGARVLATMASAIALGPALGPMIGGELQMAFGWRSGFLVLILLGLAVGASVLFGLPETNPRLDPDATRPGQIARNYRTLLTNRVFLGYAVILGGQYAGMMCYTTGLPYVLIDLHGFAANQLGYMFAYTVAGFAAGATVSGHLLARGVAPVRVMRHGSVIQLAGGGAMFAFALLGTPSPFLIVAPQILFMVGFGLIVPSALSSSVSPFPLMAGTAATLLGFFQMAIAGAAVLLLAAVYDGGALAMAAIIFATALASALALVALVRRHPG